MLPLERHSWRVCISASSKRRGTQMLPTLLNGDDGPVGNEPVVDVVTANNNGNNMSKGNVKEELIASGGVAEIAVAVSDITGEVLTATSKQMGLTYDVLRFEFDEILGFSSSDDDLYNIFTNSVDQSYFNSQSTTVVGYGGNKLKSLSLWGTPLEVDGEAGQIGRVVVRRHGGLFLRTVTKLLSHISQKRTEVVTKGGDSIGAGGKVPSTTIERLSCSFMAIGTHNITDLFASERGGHPLRAVAKDNHTNITHLSEHSIDNMQRAINLLSSAFDVLDDQTLQTSKNQELREKRRKRALKTGPSASFRRGSAAARDEAQHVDIVCRLHIDREVCGSQKIKRTTITFVEMSEESSAASAFLRCIANSTIHTPCRDSLLTLVLKSTFVQNSNNIFLGHISCDGSTTIDNKDTAETRSNSIVNTLKYSSRVLQSKATVGLQSSLITVVAPQPLLPPKPQSRLGIMSAMKSKINLNLSGNSLWRDLEAEGENEADVNTEEGTDTNVTNTVKGSGDSGDMKLQEEINAMKEDIGGLQEDYDNDTLIMEQNLKNRMQSFKDRITNHTAVHQGDTSPPVSKNKSIPSSSLSPSISPPRNAINGQQNKKSLKKTLSSPTTGNNGHSLNRSVPSLSSSIHQEEVVENSNGNDNEVYHQQQTPEPQKIPQPLSPSQQWQEKQFYENRHQNVVQSITKERDAALKFAEVSSMKSQERLTQLMEEYRLLDQRLAEQVRENVGLIAANRQYRIELEDMTIGRNEIRIKHENDSKLRMEERESDLNEMNRLRQGIEKMEKDLSLKKNLLEKAEKEMNEFRAMHDDFERKCKTEQATFQENIKNVESHYSMELRKKQTELGEKNEQIILMKNTIEKMQKEKEDREKVYHTGAEARAIRLETKLEEATIREREAKKTEELSKKLIYEKEKKITELLNKLKTEEKKEKEKMWERESLEAKNTIQELQQMLDKRCEDIVTHQNAFNRLNIEQESLKKQIFGLEEKLMTEAMNRTKIMKDHEINEEKWKREEERLEIMLRAQTVQLQQLQETLQSNGISRLISVVGEEKHSNNDVPASPSAAITFASLQPKSVPLSPTSLTSPKSSSSPSSVSRGVGPGESILSQNVTNSLSSAQTITTATTSEVNPTRSTSKITSHASSPQSQFNLAATGSVERRLVLAVRENEKLRLEMIETNEKFLKSEQKKVESRLLLQNVINLFGSLETELSHKFIKLEDELEREDEERVSLVRKIELELKHVQEKWKEEKQKMIQSNNNEHLKQSRKYNNLLNDYDNAQKRIASLDMELQRVVRNAESMNKKLIQTEEKCRDAVRKVSDLNIQVVSCRESEKAAYAALGKIRQRDSRRIAIGNRNIASSSRVMSESRVNQDIEQHQNIMIHNLRIQVSIIFYFFYSHAIIPFC
jgi:hypothetical protein